MESEGVLECPVCLEEFREGPIIQCPEGHVICENCYNKFRLPRKCAMCKAKMPASLLRNRALEHVVASAMSLGMLTERSPVLPSNVDKTCVTPRRGVKRKATQTVEAETLAKQNQIFHDGIFCDGQQCQEGRKELQGIRYKCMQCGNIDLCEVCVKAGVHEHHLLARIPNPSSTTVVSQTFNSWRATQPQTYSVQPTYVHHTTTSGIRILPPAPVIQVSELTRSVGTINIESNTPLQHPVMSATPAQRNVSAAASATSQRAPRTVQTFVPATLSGTQFSIGAPLGPPSVPRTGH